MKSFLMQALLALFTTAVSAAIELVDDKGNRVVLPQPARRIVSIAPHVTELLFAAGAGDRVVGVVDYSDFPDAARRIPRVGSNVQLDLERIAELRPDLVAVWLHGSAQRQLDRLRSLGLPIYYNEPRTLEDIARSIEVLGRLAGTEAAAGRAAQEFRTRLKALGATFADRVPVPVFWQIWERPLMTVNGNHLISDVIRLCGGRNVFAGLKPLVPTISTEAVVEANPEVIGTAIIDGRRQNGLDAWKNWARLIATARGNFLLIDTNLISRHTPRILQGAQQMCDYLETVRARRAP